MKQSPTQLSLNHLRKTCDAVQVVEKWNPHARIRQDLFGFIDILAIRDQETIAIQSTSWSNVSSRAKKIAESPLVGAVRKAGWHIIIHGWRKNKKTNRYELKEVDVS
jgi:carbonic anhydrase